MQEDPKTTLPPSKNTASKFVLKILYHTSYFQLSSQVWKTQITLDYRFITYGELLWTWTNSKWQWRVIVFFSILQNISNTTFFYLPKYEFHRGLFWVANSESFSENIWPNNLVTAKRSSTSTFYKTDFVKRNIPGWLFFSFSLTAFLTTCWR